MRRIDELVEAPGSGGGISEEEEKELRKKRKGKRGRVRSFTIILQFLNPESISFILIINFSGTAPPANSDHLGHLFAKINKTIYRIEVPQCQGYSGILPDK